MWYTKCILAVPGQAAGQLVGFGVAATELGIGWASVWVSVWALQIYDSVILACDLMCVFMASGGIGFSSSVSVYNGFGLRSKLRDGPLHNEKARGIFFSPLAQSTCVQQLAESNLRAAAWNNAACAGHFREKSRSAVRAKHIAPSRLVQSQLAQSQLRRATREK